MTDPVERVARAIFETWATNNGASDGWDECVRLGHSIVNEARQEARAAIAAMPAPVPMHEWPDEAYEAFAASFNKPPTEALIKLMKDFRDNQRKAMPATDAVREAELPVPSCTYADHSYPAFSKEQMIAYGKACAAVSHPSQGGWQLIETIPISSSGWIKRCLFGRMQPWGWEEWVGQRDSFDIWLGRKGDGGCFDCAMPTHWQPLPAPPEVQP